MYVKAAGMLLMILGSAGIGLSLSFAMNTRAEVLRTLIRMTTLLKGEISFGGSSLAEAFSQIERKLTMPVSGFLGFLAREMEQTEGESLCIIFKRGMEQYLRGYHLTHEDWQALENLGAQLGFLDRSNQIHQLELYEQEVERALQTLLEEMPGRKKVCQTLGLLGGLFLAIVLV